jgi:hypothetical protein
MKNLILVLIALPLFSAAQVKVGDHMAGGLVCKVDASGKHGLIMTEANVRDSVTYDSAIVICAATGWRLPDIVDWEGIYDVTIVKHLAKLSSTYYWEYSSTASSTSAPARYSATSDGQITFNRQKSKIALIAVKKF